MKEQPKHPPEYEDDDLRRKIVRGEIKHYLYKTDPEPRVEPAEGSEFVQIVEDEKAIRHLRRLGQNLDE